MPEVAARPKRLPFPWRLRLLMIAAAVLTALIVVGAMEALHYSSAASKPGSKTLLGFFTPKSSTPVEFSLSPLTTARSRAKMTLSELLGKPLVINMWSSTCTVCTSETPAIESVAHQLGARVTFVGVDSADERGPALAFVHRYGVTYEQLFDPTAVVATGYGIPGLPVTVFVTAGGKVVGENIGALTASGLRRDLALLFKV